jgi:hypothetical protein
MTVRRLFAPAQRLLVAVVLVLSGAYLLIYLYRWQWNRAIVSGIFFVAAEVALAASMLLRRLRRIEDQVPHALEHLRATPVDRPDPFAWLEPPDRQLGVFVPVLLGAGVILSALAYVVERVAEVTAVPVMDRRLAKKLSVIGLPTRPGDGVPPPPPRTNGLASAAFVAGVTLLLGWLAIHALLDATQSRPETRPRPASTVIVLDIDRRGSGPSALQTAEALWVSCRPTLGSQPVRAHVAAGSGDRAQLVLEPGVRSLSTRRLTGCLGDLRIDRAVADIESVVHEQEEP